MEIASIFENNVIYKDIKMVILETLFGEYFGNKLMQPQESLYPTVQSLSSAIYVTGSY